MVLALALMAPKVCELALMASKVCQLVLMAPKVSELPQSLELLQLQMSMVLSLQNLGLVEFASPEVGVAPVLSLRGPVEV